MAEHLSYLKSKSHSYVYKSENKRISRADENYVSDFLPCLCLADMSLTKPLVCDQSRQAREVMQLFTIGLLKLNDEGTVVVDENGKPIEVYTNEDIESFARAWTGFDRTSVRGNIEEVGRGSSDNRVDPLQIVSDYRDPFPKYSLDGGFIGDRYMLCSELPEQSFLKKGATFRLLGGSSGECVSFYLIGSTVVFAQAHFVLNVFSSAPELMKDPSYFAKDATFNITRVELSSSSSLYQRLFNGGDYEVRIKSTFHHFWSLIIYPTIFLVSFANDPSFSLS